jgi:hypothetical protein
MALSATQLNATGSVAGTFVYSPPAGTVLNAGAQSLSVNFTPLDSANYNAVTKSVNLTVNKASLTVTASNKTKLQGTANPALTVSYAGFVNGDTASALSTMPTATTAAIVSSPVGTYPITPAGGAAANYSFIYVAGVLSVVTVAESIAPSNAVISISVE